MKTNPTPETRTQYYSPLSVTVKQLKLRALDKALWGPLYYYREAPPVSEELKEKVRIDIMLMQMQMGA